MLNEYYLLVVLKDYQSEIATYPPSAIKGKREESNLVDFLTSCDAITSNSIPTCRLFRETESSLQMHLTEKRGPEPLLREN